MHNQWDLRMGILPKQQDKEIQHIQYILAYFFMLISGTCDSIGTQGHVDSYAPNLRIVIFGDLSILRLSVPY